MREQRKSGKNVQLFLVAAVTNYHRTDGLKHQKFILSLFLWPEVQNIIIAPKSLSKAAFPLEALNDNPFLASCSFQCYWFVVLSL